jgi:OPA family glycerol-3-phosphate transporter-like MFS transporter
MTDGTEAPRAIARRLLLRQALVVVLLFLGYCAYYFCRVNLSVGMPLLVDDLRRGGMTHDEAITSLGALTATGVLAYALGKMFLGGLGDIWGGRRSFLIGLGGAAVFTLLFAAGGGLPLFTIAWVGNRLTQSIGWAGLLKICSKWFDFSSHGAIIGVLSVSYLAGDAAARYWMGALISAGHDWRSIFHLAAIVAAVLFVANLFLLRESRTELGHRPATTNPLNLHSAHEGERLTVASLVMPLLRSRAFLLVCVLSFGCTVVRNTFDTWTPIYLRDAVGFEAGRAGSLSAVFPLLGGISVIASGWLSDRMGPNGRPVLLLGGLMATACALICMMMLRVEAVSPTVIVALIGVVAFFLLGPYSYLGGAFALDFGGRRAGAVSSGIIDGVGYLGGALAGDTVGRISVAFGWRGVFMALASVAAASAVAAAALYLQQRKVVLVAAGAD